mmetsp:Transcript_39066/g.103284  ORF Transcript_39066/g.103284 Transcript_39066/m.103284 type:complete len:426 (+) Transcript_39066:114-1391(+)
MHNNKNSHFGELNAWIWIAIPSTARGVLVSLPRFAALAFVGNGLGSNELAALSLAESWGMFWLGTAWNSVYNTTSTLVSQSYGAGKYRAARGWLLLSVALITMLSTVAAIAWLSSVPVLTAIGFDPELVHLSSTFLIPAIPMIFFNCIIIPTSAYLTATDSPWIATSIELISSVLDLVLQYVFIIGVGGIPSMGLPGAALGCNLASFVCLLLCVAVLFWGWCRPPSDADDALAVVSAAPADDCDLPARSAVLCEAPLDEASDDVCTPLLHFPDTAMSPGTKLRGADPEVYDGDFSVSCGSGNDWELREVSGESGDNGDHFGTCSERTCLHCYIMVSILLDQLRHPPKCVKSGEMLAACPSCTTHQPSASSSRHVVIENRTPPPAAVFEVLSPSLSAVPPLPKSAGKSAWEGKASSRGRDSSSPYC